MGQGEKRACLLGMAFQEGGDRATLLEDCQSGLQIGMEHAPDRIEHGQSNGAPDHEF
jgi:hypothetical protein